MNLSKVACSKRWAATRLKTVIGEPPIMPVKEELTAGRLRRKPGNDWSRSKLFEDGSWRLSYPL